MHFDIWIFCETELLEDKLYSKTQVTENPQLTHKMKKKMEFEIFVGFLGWNTILLQIPCLWLFTKPQMWILCAIQLSENTGYGGFKFDYA